MKVAVIRYIFKDHVTDDQIAQVMDSVRDYGFDGTDFSAFGVDAFEDFDRESEGF